MSEPGELAREESLDARRSEVATKLTALKELMRERAIEALHLSTVPNLAWLTAGAATSVNESEEAALFGALITDKGVMILTDPIEEPRLREEERLDKLGFALSVEAWHSRGQALRTLSAGSRLASDTGVDSASQDIQQALVTRRATLLDSEQTRLRAGARLATNVIESVASALRPGVTEREIAARLAGESRRAGGAAIVTLVGSDQRVFRYRHPLPTDKPVERYVMLVLCLRYRGLVSALTRTVSFGELPGHLLETARTVAGVDAEMIMGTTPGRALGDMYTLTARAYARVGQPEAIEQHHQGGSIAYRAREAFATPGNSWRIELGQSFAWNPSLRGAKSEDTILLTPEGPEVVTRSGTWPVWSIETPSGPIARPAILTLPA